MPILTEYNLFFPYFSPCDSKMRFVTAIFPLLSPQMPRYFKGCDRCDSKTHTITVVYTRARGQRISSVLRWRWRFSCIICHNMQKLHTRWFVLLCVFVNYRQYESFSSLFLDFFSLWGFSKVYINRGAVMKQTIKSKRTDWGSILLSRQNPVRDIARVSP